jgi:hypothetical protein
MTTRRSREYQEATADLPNVIEPNYAHRSWPKNIWIIGPESR